MSREVVLQNVRSALGRTAQQPAAPVPPLLFSNRSLDPETRVASFMERLQALAGHALRVPDVQAAARWVSNFLNNRSAIASNSPFLAQCGIPDLPGVRSGFMEPDSLRDAAAQVNVGITSADYALAETGTLVMLASPKEARLISLLPPVHVAVIPKSCILTGLDDLFTLVPDPAALSSSMVMITGPSRTADIEQILVRGVHGPGEIHAIIVDG